MENKLQRDILKAQEIIRAGFNGYKGQKIFKFDRPYLHSNEGDFYKYLDLKDKDVLTVGSSCDQMLYSLLYGANSVTLFDLNPFVKYFFELKSSAIQTLPMHQTRQLFFLKSNRELDFEKILAKLSPKMSEESRSFWGELGQEFNHGEIINNLFDKYASRFPAFMHNKGDYLALRDVLQSNPNVNIIFSNLHDLPNYLTGAQGFDVALISNVLDYYNPQDFRQDIKQLMPFMRQDGIIQANYVYAYPNARNHIKFPNKLEDVNQLFGLNAINGKIFPHLRDVLPNPRVDGSFSIPVLKENAIFLPVNDLKQVFDVEDNQNADTEQLEVDNSYNAQVDTAISQSGDEIVNYFKLSNQGSINIPDNVIAKEELIQQNTLPQHTVNADATLTSDLTMDMQ